jgi:2Fe-2S ferredoxin
MRSSPRSSCSAAPSDTGGTEHAVRIEPSGFEVLVRDGEPLMRAAQRAGYRWPNVCGGEAMCGVCHVRVLEGSANAEAMGAPEQFRLKFVGRSGDQSARLACQLRVSGSMAVFKRGVRQADLTSGQVPPS